MLIDNTPEVISELDMSVSVRVMFMQSSDVFSVTCALQELIIVPQDCESKPPPCKPSPHYDLLLCCRLIGRDYVHWITG